MRSIAIDGLVHGIVVVITFVVFIIIRLHGYHYASLIVFDVPWSVYVYLLITSCEPYKNGWTDWDAICGMDLTYTS